MGHVVAPAVAATVGQGQDDVVGFAVLALYEVEHALAQPFQRNVLHAVLALLAVDDHLHRGKLDGIFFFHIRNTCYSNWQKKTAAKPVAVTSDSTPPKRWNIVRDGSRYAVR